MVWRVQAKLSRELEQVLPTSWIHELHSRVQLFGEDRSIVETIFSSLLFPIEQIEDEPNASAECNEDGDGERMVGDTKANSMIVRP